MFYKVACFGNEEYFEESFRQPKINTTYIVYTLSKRGCFFMNACREALKL